MTDITSRIGHVINIHITGADRSGGGVVEAARKGFSI